MLQDFKYALRVWAKRPWPTVFAIAALAIGLGATIGVFGVVNALLLRSIPFYQPDRLAQFQQFIPPHDSAKQFHEWRQHSDYLTDAALLEEIHANLNGATYASRVHVCASPQSKTHQEQCILKSSLASGPNLSVAFEWPDARDFFVTG